MEFDVVALTTDTIAGGEPSLLLSVITPDLTVLRFAIPLRSAVPLYHALAARQAKGGFISQATQAENNARMRSFLEMQDLIPQADTHIGRVASSMGMVELAVLRPQSRSITPIELKLSSGDTTVLSFDPASATDLVLQLERIINDLGFDRGANDLLA